jgi:hypothetical protein
MNRAKVSQLKAQLSGYLARVRGGESIVVYDRNTPSPTWSRPRMAMRWSSASPPGR